MKLQTEMKLSQEEMGLALQDVLQEKEMLEIRGNGEREIESMIVEYGQQAYDADLNESELKIVEEELQKMELRRIQELGITCETTVRF